ncbi:hypothetical protein A3B18_02085 [Candidatus Giovannonibacteria bacterium RIFCSPLOWO2_01_FULL_46_13]|uniref:Uncharacterized protein n=1 Tax=Candidatus Giovannonibacteria bacterium RIFCSPLOWO2_01_FULL_46_13 TaxID=1798352 RepID=A0A1F5X5Z6_9BACT|nr:MAG: hypothetical protein A3B18_02085 [Candidatus Giovannonibacteria bacterium RIFCSPLOWO2_01_FULL_46_13]
MARHKNLEYEQNQLETSLASFMDSYNKNLPGGFPSATIKVLHKFRAAHPLLFSGNGDEWIIDKHRKRFMDWLSSHHDD